MQLNALIVGDIPITFIESLLKVTSKGLKKDSFKSMNPLLVVKMPLIIENINSIYYKLEHYCIEQDITKHDIFTTNSGFITRIYRDWESDMIGMVTKMVFKKSKPRKSYGFIDGCDGESYWFSLNGVEGIELGMEVKFEGARNEKGYVAFNVRPIDK